MIRVKSAEARRELAKHWPEWMLAMLKASAATFGPADEILVMDAPTCEALQAWKRGQDQARKAQDRPNAQAAIAKARQCLS